MQLLLAFLLYSLLAAPSCAGVSVLKSAATTLFYQSQIAREGRSPCRLGRDVEIQKNSMGSGLYALRDLPEGTLIGRYTGKTLTKEEFESAPTEGNYAMELANGDVVDGENPATSSFVRYINHSVRKSNCQSTDVEGGETGAWAGLAAVHIETFKDIEAGSECGARFESEFWWYFVGLPNTQRLTP